MPEELKEIASIRMEKSQGGNSSRRRSLSPAASLPPTAWSRAWRRLARRRLNLHPAIPTALRKHYGLNDKAIQFFTVHAVADQEHTAMASEIIAKHVNNERQQELVRDAARHMVRYKIAKFEGIYNAYAE